MKIKHDWKAVPIARDEIGQKSRIQTDNRGQKVSMKEGSPSLFSYPTNQHEWGDCLSVTELGQILCLLSLVLETNVWLKVKLDGRQRAGRSVGFSWQWLFMSLVVKTMVVQGGAMISKSPKKTQGVSVMYDWTNTQGQWMLHHNVRRASCGRDKKRRRRRWGEKQFLVYNFLLLCFVWWSLSSWLHLSKEEGGGWKGRTTKQKCVFFSSCFPNQEQ